MKKLQVFLFLIVLSCSGGGGGGSSGKDSGPNIAPKIDSVVFLKIVDGVPLPTETYDIGDLFNFSLIATDSDLDMQTMFTNAYLNAEPYRFFETDIPPQPAATTEYYLLNDQVMDLPDGTWQFCFHIVDAVGNESNELCAAFFVFPAAAEFNENGENDFFDFIIEGEDF